MSDTYGNLVHGIVTCRMGEETAMRMIRRAASRFSYDVTDDNAVVILADQGVTWDNVCQMNS